MGVWGRIKKAWPFAERPAQTQFVKPDPKLDFLRSAISDNLNFTSLRSMLRAAANGDLAQGLQLFDEMLEKDGNLASVAGTREKALTGLDWEIVSAADVEDVSDRKLADDAAAFVRGTLGQFEQFDETLEHLGSGVATNLAVVELVWELPELADLVCVQGNRLRMEPNEPGVVRVVTSENRKGIPATDAKWIVHTPNAKGGYPLARSMMYAQAFVYLIKMLAIADWVVFCEIFGMPIRIAKYEPGATKEEKEQLINMMETLGSKAFGVFSRAVQLEFVESSQRGTTPFKDLVEWCDRTQSKIFLGGNLVSDTTGGTGTFAASATQDEVREDLRNDDIRREARTIRRQLIGPMCGFKFSRSDVPLPHFRRIKPEVVDRVREGQLFAVAQAIGMSIGEDYAHDRLRIQKPDDGEAVLEPSLDLMGTGMAEGSGFGEAT